MNPKIILPSIILIIVLMISACVAPTAVPEAEIPEEYAKAETLVDTAWIADNLADENVRIVALMDQESYDEGHIPETNRLDLSDLTNPEDATRGQIPTQEQLSAVLSELGIENDDTVILYDGRSNLLATRAYWVLKYYQHNDVRVYNGGLTKWQADGEEISTDGVEWSPTDYAAGDADPAIRTTSEYVLENLDNPEVATCDTRGPEEYAGTDVRAERGGHIPGAINLEWSNAVNEDGTFKSATELGELYAAAGFTPDKEILTYCQTGVRGAHSWFVMRELLGYPNVRNYDGSWEEWGNNPDAPIES